MSADKETFADLIDLPEENAQEIDFAKAVGKVDKLKQDTIVKTTALMDKELSHIKREAAERDNKQEYDDHVSSAFVPIVDPNEVLSWKTPGTQPYLLRKLKNGEYREADFIDLHGKTIDEAYEIVRAFIRHAKQEEFRCVLIIHGKGSRQVKKAQMKSYVAHWLKQMNDVIAYHSAPDFKGGTGAVMVILKKGDKASALNRELHARRLF